MDSNYFDSALNSLSKTQHKRRLLQILLVIRKGTTGQQQIANVHRIQKKETLKYLIGCLNSESSNIVDITLSILGNIFCISSNCCLDAVRKFDILSHLSDVLEKYDEDSIRGRLFRIIGNLNKHDMCSNMIKLEANLIKKIINFLQNVSIDKCDSKLSEATVAMAIRSLRKLISSDTVSMFISDFEAIKVIGQLLVKYTNMFKDDDSSKAIVDDLLRLLLVLSKYKYPESFSKLKQSELGDPLLCLSTLVTTYPTRIMKIIFNFASCTLSKTDFPIRFMAENLINEIENVNLHKNIKNEELFKEHLKAVCDLMEYPVYRNDTKIAGGLDMLINLLDSMELPTSFNLECCHVILSTLIACKYDETTITRENCSKIINLLILKLKWITGNIDKINTEHSFRSNENNTITSLRRKCLDVMHEDCKRLKNDFYESDIFVASDDSSPERSVSPSSSSDISSNPNSPNYTINLEDEDLSDSDNYSPICSDNDESEPLPPQSEDCALSDHEEILKNREIPFSIYSYKRSIEDKIRILLNWYVEMRPPVMDMVNEQLVITLINVTFCSAYFNAKTFNLILKILRIEEFLLSILQLDIIPIIHDLKYYVHGSKCAECLEQKEKSLKILTHISTLAESPFGKGVIEYQLYKADTVAKQKLLLIVPYVVKSRNTLNKMLLKSGGLNVLIQLLDASVNLKDSSLKALCVLAVQLKIRHSVSNLKIMKPLLDLQRYDIKEQEDLVTFKLDDGKRVVENRNFLSNRSEYFRILLSGNFKESNEKEIDLHNVTSNSLQCLFKLLRQDIPQYGCFFDLNLDLETVLDIIGLAEQYVMLELSAYLANYVEQLYFSSKNVPIIYKWSIESSTNILRIETIAYALVGNIIINERLKIFQNIFNSGLTQHLIDDIKTLLIRFLK